MTTTINAATSTGLAVSSDGSGIVKLQSNGVTTNALAWVNFNGTGTPAIRSSYNVSSLTDVGTGEYTINFTTPLTTSTYATVVTSGGSSGERSILATAYSATTSSVNVITCICTNASVYDATNNNVAIFGN